MSGLEALVAGGLVRERVALAPLTTYKFGGPARYLAEPADEGDLSVIAATRGDVPVLVLGRGSNVVISDHGFDGLVLVPAMAEIIFHDDGGVTAGAGVPQPVLARRAVAAGRGGLEFMVGIPGSVGGAVAMNAGCHGSETRERLVTARIVDLVSGRGSDRTPDQLEMGYRRSSVRPTDVVVAATFRTTPRAPAEGEAAIREITRWRRDHQPGGTFNAGSVFKNPPGDAAGRIIEAVGLKGYRIGGASVSERHANFFVADTGASPQDVFDLVRSVRRRVQEETGVLLETEIRFIGEFDS
ncbi:MAG TPA: UDP-N-acetylmuramate dehydrogenase [Gemmatimonadales bacterium]|nr:UDP-N-acetylmuramate dehydrogenase [Gemmatimonadales bacterium]